MRSEASGVRVLLRAVVLRRGSSSDCVLELREPRVIAS
jgi:hypothetical protein